MKKQQGVMTLGGMVLNYAGYSDVGKVRECNEDDFLILPEHGVFCVADGVGGLEAGDVASKMLLAVINKKYNNSGSLFWSKLQTFFFPHERRVLLDKAIQRANAKIYVQKEDGGNNMATTLAGVHLSGKKAYVVHVGDCRVYVFRNDTLSQLTRDHSLVAELYLKGAISYAQVHDHPYRHVVTRAVGAKPYVTPSARLVDVGRGDTVLICSDGLTNMVSDQGLMEQLREYRDDVEGLGKVLVDQANQAGGRDNITLIALHLS